MNRGSLVQLHNTLFGLSVFEHLPPDIRERCKEFADYLHENLQDPEFGGYYRPPRHGLPTDNGDSAPANVS